MRKHVLLLVLAGLLTMGTVHLTHQYHGSPSLGVDDANIFLVYARHISDGHGFVYNLGGEHVEGVTSLLWTFLCSAFFVVGITPERGMLLFNVTLVLLTSMAGAVYVEHQKKESGKSAWFSLSPYPLLYLALIYSSPSYVTWMTITLMDVCLWGTLGTLGALLILWPAERLEMFRHTLFAVLIGLMVFARPEAMLVGPGLIMLFAYYSYNGRSFRDLLRHAWLPASTFVVATGVLTAFRLSYFGYPLPNTYYAKVPPSLLLSIRLGLEYLTAFLRNRPFVSLSLLSTLVILLVRFGRQSAALVTTRSISKAILFRPRPVEVTAGTAFLLILPPAISGGDHFRMARLFQPAYPMLCMTLVLLLAERRFLPRLSEAVHSRFGAASRATLGVALAFLLVLVATTAEQVNWRRLKSAPLLLNEFALAEDRMSRGRRLAEFFAAFGDLPSLGVIASGAIRRSYPGEVVDLMGLNLTRMGHSPGERIGVKNHAAFDHDVFFELVPDMLLVHFAEGEMIPRGYLQAALKGLPSTPRFRYLYEYAHVASGRSNERLTGFFKKSVIDSLRKSEHFQVHTPGASSNP